MDIPFNDKLLNEDEYIDMKTKYLQPMTDLEIKMELKKLQTEARRLRLLHAFPTKEAALCYLLVTNNDNDKFKEIQQLHDISTDDITNGKALLDTINQTQNYSESIAQNSIKAVILVSISIIREEQTDLLDCCVALYEQKIINRDRYFSLTSLFSEIAVEMALMRKELRELTKFDSSTSNSSLSSLSASPKPLSTDTPTILENEKFLSMAMKLDMSTYSLTTLVMAANCSNFIPLYTADRVVKDELIESIVGQKNVMIIIYTQTAIFGMFSPTPLIRGQTICNEKCFIFVDNKTSAHIYEKKSQSEVLVKLATTENNSGALIDVLNTFKLYVETSGTVFKTTKLVVSFNQDIYKHFNVLKKFPFKVDGKYQIDRIKALRLSAE
ncbi:TLDc domain-containing protein [Entamoeba marina]